jgi:hypothetical protein
LKVAEAVKKLTGKARAKRAKKERRLQREARESRLKQSGGWASW